MLGSLGNDDQAGNTSQAILGRIRYRSVISTVPRAAFQNCRV